MRLSSVDFKGCGFPEEYVFIGVIALSAIIMISFVLLHILIDEEYFEKKTWLPVVFHLFNSDAFTKSGNVVRVILVIFIFALILLLVSTYYFYEYGIYTCSKLT